MTAAADLGLSLRVEDAVAWIQIDRPARRNALPPQGFLALAAMAEDAGDRDDVRVIVVSGAGGEAFCAGIDVKAVAETGETRFPAPMKGDARNAGGP